MFKIYLHIIFFVFFALFSEVIQGQKQKLSKEEKKAQFIYYLSEANKNRLLENYELAIEQYNTAIDLNPNSACSYYYLSSIFFKQQNLSTAQTYAEEAVKLETENIWYKLLYGDILSSFNKYNEALKIYKTILENNDNIELVYERIESIYIKEKRINELISLYEKKQEKFFSEKNSLAVYNLYLSEKKYNSAENLLNKLIFDYPDNTKYKALKAEFYLTTGQEEKALNLYDTLKKDFPTDIYISLSYAYYCKYTGLQDQFYREVKFLISSELEFLEKIQLLYSGQYPNFKQTRYFELLNDLQKNHSDELIANTLMAEYFINTDKKKESINYIKKAIKLSNNDFNLILTLFELYYDERDFFSLYEESEKFIDLYPNKAKVYFYNAVASYHLKEYKRSIETLINGIDFVIDDNILSAQFNYYLGENYHYLKEYKKSDFNFEKAIQKKKNFYLALNSYALYLAERKEKIEKAKEMSLRCVTKKPENVSYNYTYAYILFLNKEYDEAYKYSESVIQKNNNNFKYLELHGNILYVKGLKKQALHFWKESKKYGNNSNKISVKINNIDSITIDDL